MQKTEWMEMKSDQSNPAIMNFSFLFPSLWLLGEVIKTQKRGRRAGEETGKSRSALGKHHGELDKYGVALAWGGTDA